MRLLELSTVGAFGPSCQKGHPRGRFSPCGLIMADILLFLFSQSLKSDEEADSAKEPQKNSLKSKVKPGLVVNARFGQCLTVRQQAASEGEFPGRCPVWVVSLACTSPGEVPALRFLRSDPWAGTAD